EAATWTPEWREEEFSSPPARAMHSGAGCRLPRSSAEAGRAHGSRHVAARMATEAEAPLSAQHWLRAASRREPAHHRTELASSEEPDLRKVISALQENPRPRAAG